MTSNKDMPEEIPVYCTFCNKDQFSVSHIIAGPSVFICSECVLLCNDILLEKHNEQVERLQAENKALLAQLEEKDCE